MYESFFGFASRPFAAAPVVDHYFPAQTIEQSRQTLIRIIERAEGPGLVVGPAGVGKSLLCRMLAEYFCRSFDIVMLSSARICTRKALLQNILFELGLPYRGLEEGELRLSLLDWLQPDQSRQNGMLLLVDEAHALPLRLLDEVRMITNLVRDGQPRVRLVLAGSSKLEERFAHPKLESFNQRLAARCYLEPLGYEETLRYVRAQVQSAGGNPDALFSHESLQAIHRATDGVPRLINQVCDHALLMACAGGKSQLDAPGIEEAWADLQQLPAPWHSSSPGLEHSSDPVVEFGQLDEQAETVPREAAAPSPQAPPSAQQDDDAAAPQKPSELEGDAASLMVFDTAMAAIPDEAVVPFYAGPSQVEIEEAPALDDSPSDAAGPDQPTFGEAEPVSGPDAAVEDAAGQPDEANDNPFGDEFEQEEVILDRYASLEIEAFRGRPQVSSQEGRDLSAALPATEATQAAQREDEQPSIPAGEVDPPRDEPAEMPLNEEMPLDQEVPLDQERAVAENPQKTEDQALQLIDVSQVFEYTVCEVTLEQDIAFDTASELAPADPPPSSPESEIEEGDAGTEAEVCCVEFPRIEDATPDDRDLIIIEEEEERAAEGEVSVLDDGDSELPADTQRGHRLEYQELFAQLRKV